MENNHNKVFLGGTCNETKWREKLIKEIKIPYFNPVVKDWKPSDYDNEMIEKEEKCNIHFYCITKEMQGVFSIAEVMDSVHTNNKRTFLQIIPDGFDKIQLKSLKATVELVNFRGGIAYIDEDINRSSRILNDCFSY